MEVLVAIAVATAIALGVLWVAARGAITLFVADVRDGKLEVTEGGLAPRILADLKDVVRRPRVARGNIRVVRAREHATVQVSGDFSAAQLQQLRNVVGSVPLAKLVNAAKKR